MPFVSAWNPILRRSSFLLVHVWTANIQIASICGIHTKLNIKIVWDPMRPPYSWNFMDSWTQWYAGNMNMIHTTAFNLTTKPICKWEMGKVTLFSKIQLHYYDLKITNTFLSVSNKTVFIVAGWLYCIRLYRCLNCIIVNQQLSICFTVSVIRW